MANSTCCSCAMHCVGMMHVDPSYKFHETHAYGLVEEPNNPHDSNAIMVVRTDQDGRHVGYLGTEFTRHAKSILQHGNLISISYDPEKSNQYRRVLHLEYESQALLAERRRVHILEKQLADYIQSQREPSSLSSPRKKRKYVTFSSEPPTVINKEEHD